MPCYCSSAGIVGVVISPTDAPCCALRFISSAKNLASATSFAVVPADLGKAFIKFKSRSLCSNNVVKSSTFLLLIGVCFKYALVTALAFFPALVKSLANLTLFNVSLSTVLAAILPIIGGVITPIAVPTGPPNTEPSIPPAPILDDAPRWLVAAPLPNPKRLNFFVVFDAKSPSTKSLRAATSSFV